MISFLGDVRGGHSGSDGGAVSGGFGSSDVPGVSVRENFVEQSLNERLMGRTDRQGAAGGDQVSDP